MNPPVPPQTEPLPQQAELYKLLKRTLARSWMDWLRHSVLGRLQTPIIGFVFLLLTFFCLVVVYLLTAWLSAILAQVVLWLTASLAFLLAFSRGQDVDEGVICQAGDRLQLGRLHEIFSTNRMEPCLLGILLGAQWALLSCGNWHMGVPVESMTLGTGFGYAFDNFVAAALGDFCELYGWRTMPSIDHTVWSASTFCLFRTAISLVSLLWLRLIWERFQARRLMRGFPTRCTRAELIAWIRQLSSTEKGWMLRHFEEFLFLRIAAEYLTGNFDVVERWSRAFPRLPIADELRQLFVDAEGRVLFEGFRLKGKSS